jgi:hypothetical protein
MKAKGLILTVLAGMLASSPAYAWSFCYGTYVKRHPAPVQPAANPANPEVQVAVMASAPSQTAPAVDIKTLCPTVSIWYGSAATTHATHSH